MFTGIIEELGHVRTIESKGSGSRVVIEASTVTQGTQDGDSIAVNGVCLTALDVGPGSFAADCSSETLDRSTLGNLRPASVVNLERAISLSSRLGGHIVQGHVDGRGRLLRVTERGGSWSIRISYPPEIAPYLVYKGSVAVEGISLTVAALAEDYFEVAVISKTWKVTNLAHLRVNDMLNLEADIMAKYIERIMFVRGKSTLTMEKLEENGYLRE